MSKPSQCDRSVCLSADDGLLGRRQFDELTQLLGLGLDGSWLLDRRASVTGGSSNAKVAQTNASASPSHCVLGLITALPLTVSAKPGGVCTRRFCLVSHTLGG